MYTVDDMLHSSGYVYVHSSSGLVDMVVCGQVSTTHAESARNSKPASLRALDACAPIFTNNDDHDEDNNGDDKKGKGG